MRFSDGFLSTVRDRASIAAYAARKLSFDQRKSQPQRGDYWACCPFHGEKTASFHVLDRRGLYKCFGCHEAGDIFKLAMKLEGLTFPEAVARIAAEAGVPLPEEDPATRAADDARSRAMAALADAQSHFERALRSADGRAARAYLERRGLPEAAWAQFGIGWAPAGWTATLDALRKAGRSLEDLRAAGLVRERDGRAASDFFHGRVTFPIQDAQARVIGFGGRLIEPGEPKYLNSPDSLAFHKGRALYRLHAARAIAARGKAEGLIVTEGYLDAIACERAGLPAVAPLGTALTEDQLALLWRAGPSPILCFDGDAAGQRAAARALDLALPHFSPERTLRFAHLPAGADPDDVLRRDGPEALQALLASPQAAIEALFARERDRKPLDTPEAKAGLKARLREACGRIAHADTRAFYLRDLLARADAVLRPPRAPMPAGRAPGRERRGPQRMGREAVTPTEGLRARARAKGLADIDDVLRLAVDWPTLLERGAEALAQLPILDRDLDRIRHGALDLFARGEPLDRSTLSRHLLSFGEVGAAERLARWPSASAAMGPAAARAELDEATEAQWMALVTLDLIGVDLSAELAAVRARESEIDDDAFARLQAELHARRSRAAAALISGDAEPAARDPQAPH